MSQATISANEPIPAGVASKLRGLRTKITTWLLIDGLSRVLLVFVAAVAIHFLADWLFDLDIYQRLGVAAIGLAVVAAVAYYRLLVPLTTAVTDDALILAVEGHYGKELGESLISAVQFSRIRDVRELGVSPQLVKASIDQGTSAAERIQFGSIIDSGWMFANLALLAACIVLVALGGVAIANNAYGDAWWRRIQGENVPYPQDTYLEVQYAEGDELKIPRGDDWPLIVTVKEGSKKKPEVVYVDIVGANGRRTETMDVVDKQQRFRVDLKNVVEEFEFQARTDGRGRTPWIKVHLVERPAVESLKITKTFPKYAGGAKEELPAGTGPHHVLEGSSLQISGVANKPLSQGTLLLGETPVPLKIAGENQFSATIPAGQMFDGGYLIHLVDQETLPQPGLDQPGPLESKRPTRFTIRVKPDESPNVAAKLQGISGMVVPQAMIPFECFIKDEFSITDVQLMHQWKHEENSASIGQGKTPLAAVKEMIGERSMRFDDVFDIEPLKIAPGSGLSFLVEATDNNNLPYIGASASEEAAKGATVGKVQTDSPAAKAGLQAGDVIVEFDGQPVADFGAVNKLVGGKKVGDKVIVKVERKVETKVDDKVEKSVETLDLELEIGRRGIGKSTMFLLRVVSENELWTDLVRRQIEQRQDFERLHKNVEKYLTDCQAMEAETREAKELSSKQRQDLLQLQKDHKLLATNIGNVAGRLLLIVDEIQNNRLEDPKKSPIREKLFNNVINPMQQLAGEDVPHIVRQIDATRNKSTELQPRNAVLADVIASQQRVGEAMKRILSNMEEAEGYQEAVQALYDVLKIAEDVRGLTVKERERLIQEILEGREPKLNPTESPETPPESP